jgi:hypothetical protein
MTAVFYALRACSTAAHHSRMLTGSVFIAENLLIETMLNENTAFETTEGQNESYSWKVQIAPTPVENLGAVHVQVGWKEQNRGQQYDLFSLIQMKSF